MRKIIVIILVVTLMSFNTSKDDKYFEGIVTYELSYKPINKNITVSYLEHNYGVKEYLYFKKGFSRKVRLNKSGDTVYNIISNPIDKRVYGQSNFNKDTIITYSTNDNVIQKYELSKVKSEKVLGKKTIAIRQKLFVKDKHKRLFNTPDTLIGVYYFSKKYKINSNDMEYKKDGFYNEIVEKYPYLIVKYIDDDTDFKRLIKTAVKIEEVKLDDEIFKIDFSKPIKEI